ncbi:hypothetical protein IO90_19100 [Chryseobacterium sp. FH1]|nr:hypothetical protein IO90_19100 [Chryseobacterium sp. FH1]
MGNVRVSFTKGTNGSAEVTDRNDYYAFGMNQKPSDLTAPTYAIGGEYTNYKYNGKELQENGTYDYGARFYMSDLGRWFAVDPLAEVSRRWSPYAYAYNNPVRFIDPDGMKNVSATSSIDDDDIEIDTGYRTVTKKTAVFGTGGMSGRLSEKGALKMANNIIAQMENGGKDKIIAGIYGAGPKSQSNNPEFEKLIKSMGGTLFKSSIGGGDNEIIEYLKQGYEEGKLISIYGYSRGGNAAVRITNKLGELNIPVYNLVTFDAHSITGGTFELQYNNVTYAANFYQQNPRTWANGYLLTRGILPFGVNPYIGSPVHSKYINVFQVNYTNKNITGKPVNHFNIIDSALYKNIFHPEIKR